MKHVVYLDCFLAPSTLRRLACGLFAASLLVATPEVCGQEPAAGVEQAAATQPAITDVEQADIDQRAAAGKADLDSTLNPDDEPQPRKPLSEPKGAVRMNPKAPVWVDRKQGRVLVDGVVSLRRGVLEMFACPYATKEHESIVAVNAPAFLIHSALLAVGAKPGAPVQWEPEYAPPFGDRIDITLQWRKAGKDDGPMQTADARQWVRDARTRKPMQQHWVFAGSGFWKDEESGREYYLAEAGDMICVSNFGSAMLDIPDNSPQANDGLLFEAFTDRIPPVGTPVRMVLTPKLGSMIQRKAPKSNNELSKEFADGLKEQPVEKPQAAESK